MTELNKTFDPAEIEARWYAHWESTGAFRPARPDATPYTIVMPPPNVTGSLHIGHALDNTLQDILIRYERLRGKDALWVAGTDHAGIATQMVVERQMALRQDKRTNYSREDFIAKVWEWKAESGGQITQQLRRLGASCDWANERFTMDEGFSKAVLKVFVDMYNEGLIYRDKRLVNWDPGLKTAISDLEVETREINGKFWHFRYPLADGLTYRYTERDADGQITLEEERDYIVVATTRPETMLADMAVAANAKDERYQSLLAAKAHVILPITGRRIPIIADDHADPALGSGAVKITPGHDFNDFEVGKRAGIAPAQMLNMLDADGRVVQVADELIPAEYLGLYRFGIEGEPTNARKRVAEAIDALGLLERIEDRVIQTPFGDRSGVVIEPWLTDQWYVDAKTLAGPAIEAVRNGDIKIVPESWAKTWFQWLENIQPWCISRQLWWGHQIPVWYGFDINNPNERVVFVAENVELVRQQIVEYYGKAWQPGEIMDIAVVADEIEARGLLDKIKSHVRPATKEELEAELGIKISDDEIRGESVIKAYGVWRDPDVLDTWFSSALWPFATLGWPEKSDLLARHYPNDVLISGFDILFFWDARMAMQGLHQMKEVPWKTLYLHGLVRAADGSKMSKSKGNTVDPLGLIDKYGADALRFFMAAMESQGRDIKMDERRLEGYRNFATKLWNAARFCQANGIGASTQVAAPEAALAVNKWIIGEVVETVTALDKALADLRFDEAANVVYHFVWDQFCDWYLEMIKPAFVDGEKGEMEPESKLVAGWVLDQILVMLHPFMPFITEELWHALADPTHPRSGDLIHAAWVNPEASVDAAAKSEISRLIQIIADIRTQRTALEIAPGKILLATVATVSANQVSFVNRYQQELARMARVSPAHVAPGTGSVLAGPNPQQFVISDNLVLVGHKIQFLSGDLNLISVIEGYDLDAERARLTKAIEAATKEAASLAGRLSNPSFVEKAKPEAVEKARADHAEKSAEAERLQAALARLG